MKPPPPSTPRLQAARPPVNLCGSQAPQPGHVCAFFDSATEKYEVLGEYFRDAIAAGDHLINIVEADKMGEHVHRLEELGVPVEQAVDMNRMTLGDAESTYLRDGSVDVDGVFELVRAALQKADADGRCVRTCGDMSWIGRAPDALDAVMAYEARVNLLLPTCECTLLCVYDLANLPAYLVADVLATHEYAIMNRRLRRNPFFVPPGEYLSMLRQRSAQV